MRDGYADRIVLGQDIGVRTRLRRWGGWGYAHLLEHVVPLLRDAGVDDAAVDRMLVANPARLLAVGGMTGNAPRPSASDAADRLTRLSPSLWWYRDTCNVYLWTSGERGLLIDFGSGGILDVLEQTGVREIEAIVHTHHHRDQCGGDDRAVELGIPIWVPERERGLFATAEAFWTTPPDLRQLRRVEPRLHPGHLAAGRARPAATTSASPGAAAPSRRSRRPGTRRARSASWPRSTAAPVASSGDLIAGHGRVPTLHDLQWQYGMPDAVGAALHSAVTLARREPATLLPSHGAPIDEAGASLRALVGSLRDLAGLLAEIRRNRLWTTWPSSVDQPLTQVLPHLWVNSHSVANTYALVDDDGDALILDYGFPSWDHFFADQRFVAHTLDEFRAEAGLRRVRATVPSHYHDDHLAGVPWLQREHGAEAWIHDSFAGIVAEPARYDLPCLLAEPIRVDRVLADGDLVEHAGAALETFHMPGHTMFALGLAGVLDGVRVAYTGDNLLAGALSPLRASAPIYRNVLRLESIRLGCRAADRPRARAAADRPHRRARGEPRGPRRVRRLGARARAGRRAARSGPGPGGRGARPVCRAIRPVPGDGRRRVVARDDRHRHEPRRPAAAGGGPPARAGGVGRDAGRRCERRRPGRRCDGVGRLHDRRPGRARAWAATS